MSDIYPAADTPDEWLLARYDRLAVDPRRKSTTFERPIFELIDDTPEGAWPLDSGVATWPEPRAGHSLDRLDERDQRRRATA